MRDATACRCCKRMMPSRVASFMRFGTMHLSPPLMKNRSQDMTVSGFRAFKRLASEPEAVAPQDQVLGPKPLAAFQSKGQRSFAQKINTRLLSFSSIHEGTGTFDCDTVCSTITLTSFGTAAVFVPSTLFRYSWNKSCS